MLHYFQILQAVLELLWEQNHVFCWQNIEHRNHLSSVYRYLQCNVPHYSYKVSLSIRKPSQFAISWSIAHIVLAFSSVQLIYIIVLLHNSYMNHFVKKLHRYILLLHYFYYILLFCHDMIKDINYCHSTQTYITLSYVHLTCT